MTEELQDKYKTVNKITIINPSLSIITLNESGLNFSMKRYRVAEWLKMKANSPTVCYLQEAHFRLKVSIGWKWEEEKDISHKW